MKKKILCLFAILLFGMLILCACGGGEDYAFMASSTTWCSYGDYVFSMSNNGILQFRKAIETEERPLCFDPLCDHFMENCPAYAPGAREAMLAARNRDGEICIYYAESIIRTEKISDGAWPYTYRLCCINMQTGEKTVILNEQSGRIYQFFLYGNDIYMQLQGSIEKEEGKSVSKAFLWKMSLDGSNLVRLSTTEVNITKVLAAAERKGRTVIFWEDYMDNRSLYVSSEDFSENTKLLEGIATYESFVVGDYLYYAIEDPELIPEVRVKAPEDGLTPGATYTVYHEVANAAYYRLNLTDPDAEPELMYDGVSSVYSSDARLLWANGDKIYVIPYDPVFFEVLDAYAVIDYVNTETQPHKIPLRYQYINARSGMKIIEIDLVTGERREISTPGFNPETIMSGDDEKLIVRGSVVDMDRIRARIEENGIKMAQETYMFWEIREIPLNP